MAISDEKRREIAARLRGVTEEELRSMFLGEILDCAIGGRCLDDEGDIDERLILNRLADLIDRPTCELDHIDTDPAQDGYPLRLHECSNCRRLCYEIYGEFEYCPHCGAEVQE